MIWLILAAIWLVVAVFVLARCRVAAPQSDEEQAAADEEQMRALLRDAKDPLAGTRGWEEHA